METEAIYEPSPSQWVRDQVEIYERTGGKEGNTLRDTGLPVVIITSLGAKSNKIRKTPVMRAEKDGNYVLVASKGGAPENPEWYYNLKAHPDNIMIQDGPDRFDVAITELDGKERAKYWELAVEAYPPYAEYQEKTDRKIPVFLATKK